MNRHPSLREVRAQHPDVTILPTAPARQVRQTYGREAFPELQRLRAESPFAHTAEGHPTPAPIKRTPELALIMAIFEQMSEDACSAVFRRVNEIADRCPDCDASQEAARIAALLIVAKGGKA